MQDYDYYLFDFMKSMLDNLGYDCKVIPDEEDSSVISLRFAVDKLGEKQDRNALFEMFFVPVDEDEDPEYPYSILSVAATLAENYPSENIDALNRMCMNFNVISDGGAFITYDDPTTLVCKSELVIRHSYDDETRNQLCMDLFHLVLNDADEFIDDLLKAAYM